MDNLGIENIAREDIGLTALRQAARKVVEEAKRKGTSVVVWEDGKVREIPADELPDPAALAEEGQ
jgi:hypothetical protein